MLNLSRFLLNLPPELTFSDLLTLTGWRNWEQDWQNALYESLKTVSRITNHDYFLKNNIIIDKKNETFPTDSGILSYDIYKNNLKNINNLVERAYDKYKTGKEKESHVLFKILGSILGNDYFFYNIKATMNLLNFDNEHSIEQNHKDQTGWIEIVYVLDNKFFMPTATSFISLIKTKSDVSRYSIHIITTETNRQFEEFFNKFSTEDIRITIYHRNIETYLIPKQHSERFLSATTSALLKFEIPNIIKNRQKAIYIDGDTIIAKDLTQLYNIDINNYYAAVVRDLPQVCTANLFTSDKNYFNSGMMLLNLDKLRKDNIVLQLKKLKKLLSTDTLMDQNVFNIVFKNQIKFINIKYNFAILNMYRELEKINMDEINKLGECNFLKIDEITNQSAIIHYSSKQKPWKFYDTPGNELWMKYFLQTGLEPDFLRYSAYEKSDIYEPSPYKNTIVCCLNRKYINNLIVLIKSIAFNNHNGWEYNICILQTDFNQEDIKLLTSLVIKKIKINILNIKNLVKGRKLFTRAHYTKEMFYRFFIPRIFMHCKKVLYLDADMVVDGNIEPLFTQELDNYLLAGIKNHYIKHMEDHIKDNIGIPPDTYINSGVLLFNIKKCLENDFENKCFDALTTLKSRPCPDQDAINYACKNKILFLKDSYNFQTHFLFKHKEMKNKDRENIRKIGKNAIIYHFTSGDKPWNYPEHPFKKIYDKYQQMN